LLIVAGELTSNAIRHGGGSGRLRLWNDGGRGIWICRSLTTELTTDTGPDGDGATVTAAIPPPASEDRDNRT